MRQDSIHILGKTQWFSTKLCSSLWKRERFEREVSICQTSPTEVHVHQSSLVKTICHPSMAIVAERRRTIEIDGKTIADFLLYQFEKSVITFRHFGDDHCVILKVFDEGVFGLPSKGTTIPRCITHVHGYPHIAHQLCYGIALRFSASFSVVVDHVVPIVVRLLKIHLKAVLIVRHGVFVCAFSLHWPVVVFHDLSNGRGHAARVGIGLASSFTQHRIIRFHLVPFGLQQRSNGFARNCCRFRAKVRRFVVLQSSKVCSISFQHIVQTWVCDSGV